MTVRREKPTFIIKVLQSNAKPHSERFTDQQLVPWEFNRENLFSDFHQNYELNVYLKNKVDTYYPFSKNNNSKIRVIGKEIIVKHRQGMANVNPL